MQLARDLCTRLAATYRDGIVVGGVYGSTARGTDTAWSDLELVIVVRDGSPVEGKRFIYRGISVHYRAIEQRKLEELLGNPSLEWPFWMGILSVLTVLYGRPEDVQSWLQLGQAVPAERFRRALEHALPGLVTESLGRILSCRERHNTPRYWPRSVRSALRDEPGSMPA